MYGIHKGAELICMVSIKEQDYGIHKGTELFMVSLKEQS